MSEPRSVTILVVDDNEAKRYSVVRILRQAGFHVLEATTGEEALQMAAMRPDLMVLDVKLPGISGFDVCRRIKSDPELAATKVLHVSATFIDSDHRVEGLAHGADGYLVQPVEPGELVETVRALLRLRETEDVTRRTAREWRATFDALVNGILLLDDQSRVLRCNRAMRDIIGQPFHAIVGMPCADILPDPLAAVVPSLLCHVASSEENPSPEILLGSREFQITTNSVFDEHGRATGAVLVFTDVTERKRLESELRHRAEASAEADHAKDEFLAMLGHELRNPLAPVRNAVELLRRMELDPKAQHLAEIMDRQTAHMTRMVDDLLDISRITRGHIELHREALDLAEIVDHAVETTRASYASRGQTLHVALPDEPIRVDGDRQRLVQVVANLLNNAAKYSDPNSAVTLVVEPDGGWVAVRVRDEGVGIEPELLPRVFDLFTQGDHTLNRAQGGLGVGLTLVKQVVESHGGSIEARSEGPGRGSEFILRLPVPTEAEGSEGGDGPSEAEGGTIPLRILLVEDNRDTAETMREVLEAWGHTVSVCSDGPSALWAARETRWDVVLLDIGLPGMDGYEVARRMRRDLCLTDMAVVAITGYGQERDRSESREAGFDAHLVKPVDFESLRRLLGTMNRIAS